jgi:hypothetical protein
MPIELSYYDFNRAMAMHGLSGKCPRAQILFKLGVAPWARWCCQAPGSREYYPGRTHSEAPHLPR